jgi:hypothetical protein
LPRAEKCHPFGVKKEATPRRERGTSLSREYVVC